MTLQRLILTIKPDGVLELRVLYRSKDGPKPGTKKRRREVEALAREGLRHALEALDAGERSDYFSGFLGLLVGVAGSGA